MTQQHIEEFLKYASPRLDYIGYCMEKQAKPNLQKAVRLFAGKPGARLFSYKNVAKHAPKGSPGAPGGTVNKRYATQHAAQSAALAEQLMGKKEYAAEIDKLINKGYDSTQAARIVQNKLAKGLRSNKQLGAVPETMEQVRSAAGTIRPVKYEPPVRNTSGKASDVSKAKDSESGVLRNLETWFKTHPYLSAAGTAAGGSALGTGLGYALGQSSGSDEATKKLHTYYAINEALRSNALRRANSDILARLANIFGMGELNNLIGG